jgi:hypothetical protein
VNVAGSNPAGTSLSTLFIFFFNYFTLEALPGSFSCAGQNSPESHPVVDFTNMHPPSAVMVPKDIGGGYNDDLAGVLLEGVKDSLGKIPFTLG